MKKIISVLVILLGIIFFFFGLELLGIIVAVVGLFLFPNAHSAGNVDPYYDEYLFDNRDDSTENEASDSSSDYSGGKDD